MKTAIRLTSACAVVALLLSQTNPKVFAQGDGNSTVNCDAGGVNLQTKLNNASAGATVWVTGTCSQGPYTISKDVSLAAYGPNGATLSAPNGRHVLIVQGATVRLEEVQINGGAGAGILVHGGTLFANRIVVQGAEEEGVRLGVHSHGTMTNSTFRNNRHGFETTESSGAFLQGNVFESNGVAGLAVNRSSSAIVEANTFKDNAFGVAVESNGSILLRQNAITGNTSAGVIVRQNGFLDTVDPPKAFTSNGRDVRCLERGMIDATDGPQQPNGAGTVNADFTCLITGTLF